MTFVVHRIPLNIVRSALKAENKYHISFVIEYSGSTLLPPFAQWLKFKSLVLQIERKSIFFTTNWWPFITHIFLHRQCRLMVIPINPVYDNFPYSWSLWIYNIIICNWMLMLIHASPSRFLSWLHRQMPDEKQICWSLFVLWRCIDIKIRTFLLLISL